MPYSGGSGVLGDPFLIGNVTDLKDIELNMGTGVYFKQIADVTLGTFEPIGYGSPPTVFSGYYDGDNYKILDGDITYASNDYIGLFASKDSSLGGYIKNLTLDNIIISGRDYTAGIAGYSYSTDIVGYTFSNIHIKDTCSINGRNEVGGIVGHNKYSVITNCENNANITGTGDYVGGIFGNFDTTLTGSGNFYHSNNKNSGYIKGVNYVGGIAGRNKAGLYSWIYYSLNTGIIEGVAFCGGISGYSYYNTPNNKSQVKHCYALQPSMVRTSGSDTTFHRVSYYPANSGDDCYALDTMIAPFVGAFSDKTLTGDDGADVTAINSKKIATYTGNSWSFPPWQIAEDETYPFLYDVSLTSPSSDISLDSFPPTIEFEITSPTPNISLVSFAPTIEVETNVPSSDISMNSFAPNILYTIGTVPDLFAIQEIFKIYLFDLVTGRNIAQIIDLKETHFINDQYTVYSNGGVGNPNIVGFDHSKTSRMEIKDATYNLLLMGAQIGTTPVVGANTEFVYNDIIKVSSNIALSTYTALGLPGIEINFAYELNSDGSTGDIYEQDSIVGPGKFTYNPTSKILTFNSGEITDDTEIILWYRCTTDVNTLTLSNYSNVFSNHVKMIAVGLVKNICTDENSLVEIIYNSAKLSGNFDINLIANGEVPIQDLTIEAVSSCENNKLWDMLFMV